MKMTTARRLVLRDPPAEGTATGVRSNNMDVRVSRRWIRNSNGVSPLWADGRATADMAAAVAAVELGSLAAAEGAVEVATDALT